jgi:hypothetical protein
VIDSTTPAFDWSSTSFLPGCLPRSSKPGERFPMAADHIKLVPKSDWDLAAAEIDDDLRVKVPTVLNQGQYGACACAASTGALMLARAIQGWDFVPLNMLFMYHTTSHGSDSGSKIDEDLEFARDNGIASEAIWPFSKGFKATPSPEAVEDALKYRIVEAYDITNVNEFVSALLTGFAVVFGSQGHAVLAVQYTKDYPLILNSWNGWGENNSGFGRWCSWNAINWGYGAWAIRLAL